LGLIRLTADCPGSGLRFDGDPLSLPRLSLQRACIRVGPLGIALRLLQLQLGQHGLADGGAGRG
jgi:hypothetical protein